MEIFGNIFILSIPIFVLIKLIGCIYRVDEPHINKLINIANKLWVDIFYTVIIIGICSYGFMNSFSGLHGGEPLSKYELGGYMNGYASLAPEHILTIIVFFILGVVAYFLMKFFLNKLTPVVYTICSSLLILNIIFTVIYFIQTNDIKTITLSGSQEVWILRIGFALISLLYISQLVDSLIRFVEEQRNSPKNYNNKLLNILYRISIKYQMMPILWIISLFPVLIVIQLILVIFGQQPDSFIRAFLDTSSFNYSRIIAPPPITVPGDGHYLCTVSVKGHKKIVKPIRSGIRRNERIVVNRQLLVANAFENIMEEYTPKLHKVIRYIYDRYGYPISIHINTAWSADLTYIFMKPLEWFFILVLYTVDKNPENRINIQYSELRR